MKASEIRTAFIEYFKTKSHSFVQSAPLFSPSDPSLLFMNAGMNQFKDIFLGIKKDAPYTRAVNSQKCMRVSGKHNDLEEVGRDGSHHTFFEMLGNWSFGDYYKKEAIQFGWDFLTKEMKLPKDKLWASIYTDDDEAEELWKNFTDVDPNKIKRFGKKDNFWEMGETGPCGPCSEIHIEFDIEPCGPNCTVNCECGRFMELWNLVFIQYERQKDGSLKDLEQKHIDTGMGLERIVSVVQGKTSNYETDLFYPIIEQLSIESKIPYSTGDAGIPFRVIADHIRALVCSIADGVLPSNESRGYVIRRLLRRAYRFGRKLNYTSPFLHNLVDTVITILGEAYPETLERKDFIKKIILSEEVSFEKTLDRGIGLFEELAKKLKNSNIKIVPGKDVFKLYDTYGFPADLTNQMAEESGLTIDTAGFETAMEVQKDKARKATGFIDMGNDSDSWIILNESISTDFIGYSDTQSKDLNVIKYKENDKNLLIVLDKTPFYAESGGQCGDIGELQIGDTTLKVSNCIKDGSYNVHVCQKTNITDWQKPVNAIVNSKLRESIKKNHTSLHLLQSALRTVLGDHIKQSGSFLNSKRGRFDFTHYSALTKDEIKKVETEVNRLIFKNLAVKTEILDVEDARKKGATALFGEKYGNTVRTVFIGKDESIELCGGIHANTSSELGFFTILSESSISAGIRRIECITGEEAQKLATDNANTLASICDTLKTKPKELLTKIDTQLQKIKKLESTIKEHERNNASSLIENFFKNSKEINGIKYVAQELVDANASLINPISEQISSIEDNAVWILLGNANNKVSIFVKISASLKSKGLHAGKIVSQLAEILGGRGGGKPEIARGGGKDTSKIIEALNAVPNILSSFTGKN